MDMPIIGLGTYQIPAEDCTEIIKHAIEIGYRHFDTAQVFLTENRCIETSMPLEKQ